MPSPMFRYASTFVLAAFCSTFSIGAQTPATPAAGAQQGIQEQPGAGYHLNVTTRIVILDVVVTDKHGKLVDKGNLTKDDFTIYESKVPQTIVSFETPAQHAMPVSDKPIVNSAADLVKIGDAPVTMLVLDELNSKFEDMSFSRNQMIKYLQSQPPVLKQPTVLLIAMNTKFVQVHDYTQNRDELIETVKKHMPEFPWRMMNGGRGGAAAVERMAQGLAALQQLAQASAGTPGRKNVIWVGNGFPSADLVGLDQQEADLITAAFRAVSQKLLASRITMYTINPVAGSSSTVDIETPDDLDAADPGSAPTPFGEGTVNFTDFAPATGGMSFQGRNDINNVIEEGIAHGDNYYTMSYSPTDKTDDPTKFRNINIVMKDPNLRATTRNGYFTETAADVNPLADKTITDKQKQRDLALDLSQALTTTISYNGLGVTAAKDKDGNYTIHVKEENLTWSDPGPDGAQHSEATVAVAGYDKSGKVIGHVAREETFPRGATGTGATFNLPAQGIPASATRMRIVVRDALSGRMGTFDITK
jgi:VWFA-related protein